MLFRSKNELDNNKNLTAEGLASGMQTASAAIKQMKSDLAAIEAIQDKLPKEERQRLEIAKALAAKAELTQIAVEKEANQVMGILQTRDLIAKTFQKEISHYEKINGYLDKNFNVARSSLEVRKNELELLDKSTQTGLMGTTATPGEDARLQRQRELANTSGKIMLGGIVAASEELKKINDDLKKQLVSLNLDLLDAINESSSTPLSTNLPS